MSSLPSKVIGAVAALMLCAGVASGTAAAQTLMQPTTAPAKPPAAPKPAAKMIYLPVDFLAHPALILPMPPKPDSVDGQRDLAATKALQAAASPERIAKAASDDKTESVWLYEDILPGFTPAKLPLTEKLFTAAQNDTDLETNLYKNFFARLRPFDVDHTVKVCVPSTYGAKPRSYPSGHATLGYSLGVILAHLVPEKAEAIMARAKAYGESRVVCGVHFPSDLAASETLGTATALELMRNPEFKKAFAAAKSELAAAGFTKETGAAN